ncbi:MAG TPA: flagellar basal body rod protein FlgC [Chloroflexota bacterium]|nr:flagellar basal body rod protein FlgC [Chloroflexota bacterium]
MSVFAALRTSASGLTAQRLRMDLITNNIANAETTRTAEGGAYRRQQVLFTPRVVGRIPFFNQLRGDQVRGNLPGLELEGVRPVAIVEDQSPTRMVYDPTHPDANPDGFVEYPNVNIVTEMADMLSATRSYEANVTVLNAAKQMAQRAIDIAR